MSSLTQILKFLDISYLTFEVKLWCNTMKQYFNENANPTTYLHLEINVPCPLHQVLSMIRKLKNVTVIFTTCKETISHPKVHFSLLN